MDAARFEEIVNKQLDWCLEILGKKAKEYGAVDRLHNFKIAAGLQQVPKEQALVGMMTKHIVSIYDMGMSGKSFSYALWNEKIGDSINYLLILRALIEEDPAVISYDKDFVNPNLQTSSDSIASVDEEKRPFFLQRILFNNFDTADCALNHLKGKIVDNSWVPVSIFYAYCEEYIDDVNTKTLIPDGAAEQTHHGWNNLDSVQVKKIRINDNDAYYLDLPPAKHYTQD